MAEFKNEYEYLIHLIKCAIRDLEPEEKPQELSFEKVFKYGKTHEVANIAFVSLQKLNSKPDEEVYKAWKTFFAFSVSRHANQLAVRAQVTDALGGAGIRTLEAQGTVMKTLYPEPQLRMMTDIDFIIDKENLSHAEEIMKGLGYQTTASVGADLELCEVDATAPDGTYVELHSDFFERDNTVCYGTISNPFNSAKLIDGSLCYRADDTAFYLYSLLHCIKHYAHRGCGIRRMLDMYIISEKLGGKIDAEYVNSVLEKSGLKETADEVFALAYKWFGDKCSETDLSEAEQTVFASGNHGTIKVKLNNEYKRSGKSGKKFFKIKSIVSRLFLSKEDIYSGYPFCRKHNYPIVLCWIHRWLCFIFLSEKRKKAHMILSSVKDAELK